MNRRRRQGFTLVEMLVVMAILLLLMAIGVAFLPGMYQRTNTPITAQMLQKALVKARVLAMRDRRISGVSFAQSPTFNGGPTQYDSYTSTQQPDDATLGVATSAGPNAVQLTGCPATALAYASMQGGAIEFNGVGVPHLISSVSPAGLVTLVPNAPAFTLPSGNNTYRLMLNSSGIISTGNQQEKVTFPGGAVVDLAYSTNSSLDVAPTPSFPPTAGPLSAQTPLVIQFSPSGSVTGTPVGIDRYIFYIRDSNNPNPLLGQPMLVVVYVRTGLVAIQPVDQTAGGNPYSFATNPVPSGL